ncbi:MAG: hypothetical protein J6V60_02075 [Muribaculaceae bacterium]|nr:hypothetical protein [Muribaculaceae bacterium]
MSISKISILSIALASVLLISCDSNTKKVDQEDENNSVIIVNHPDDVNKYGEGAYINTNSEYTCPHCGLRVHRDNIFHDCQGTKFNSNSSSSSYSETPDDAHNNGYDNGYEQGLEDGKRGKRHGYNYDDSSDYYDYYETRYQEGYEEGYEEGYYEGKSRYEDEQEDEEDDW